jgi:predicted TIM-barrel fold metal-dependent hydrolase
VSAVQRVNDQFFEMVHEEEGFFTAGTLHPAYGDIDGELDRLSCNNVRALKFSSFSQGIDLEAEETFRLFDRIRNHNLSGKPQFSSILDTFYQADRYFGASERYITTPKRLGRLVKSFPEINFIAAHMGGLAAPFAEIYEHLSPQSNLYLETSNAAHVLFRSEFLRLVDRHGPERILFGTDWPWFGHREEIPLIHGLLKEAGFSEQEQKRVFCGNISRLLQQ